MITRLLKIGFIMSSLILGVVPNCFAFTCKQGNVERAGVALIKHYPQSNAGLEYVVLVGIDAHKTKTTYIQFPNGGTAKKTIPYVNFFAGKCADKKNKLQYSSQVAAEELFEETGGMLKISAHTIKNMPYVYSGDFSKKTRGKNYIQLFFHRDDNLMVTDITNAQIRACNNVSKPTEQREVRATCAIPLQLLLNKVRQIAALEKAGHFNQANEEKLYCLETRGDGHGNGRKWVFLDPQYMRNLARDLKRFEQICFQLTYGQIT